MKSLTTCLNVIDFQNDFVAPKGVLSFDNGTGDTALIKRMEVFFKKLPVDTFDHALITLDTHFRKTYAQIEESKNFPLHCEINTWGWQTAIPLGMMTEKLSGFQILHKSGHDMWTDGIYPISQRFLTHPQKVTLVGVASDICNKFAIDGWLKRNATVTVISDLTRGIFKETEEVLAAKEYEKAIQSGQLRIIKMDQFFKELQK